MHDDATAILRSYTEEAVAKSRKENHVKSRPFDLDAKSNAGPKARKDLIDSLQTMLSEASDDELVAELARRRAARFRLAGAMSSVDTEGDATGQICSLNGGKGTIPCRELME